MWAKTLFLAEGSAAAVNVGDFFWSGLPIENLVSVGETSELTDDLVMLEREIVGGL